MLLDLESSFPENTLALIDDVHGVERCLRGTVALDVVLTEGSTGIIDLPLLEDLRCLPLVERSGEEFLRGLWILDLLQTVVEQSIVVRDPEGILVLSEIGSIVQHHELTLHHQVILQVLRRVQVLFGGCGGSDGRMTEFLRLQEILIRDSNEGAVAVLLTPHHEVAAAAVAAHGRIRGRHRMCLLEDEGLLPAQRRVFDGGDGGKTVSDGSRDLSWVRDLHPITRLVRLTVG